MSDYILFQEDWSKFSTAIIDYDTKNTSFLRNVALYHDMGIKNCAFSLALLQPQLKGIDPHDPDLDAVTLATIGIECAYNPWYYFREVHRIPAVSANVASPLSANRGNIALWWLYFNHIDVALIQPRQTGKSVSTDSLMTWLLQIGATNTQLTMITKDDQLRKANVARLKKMVHLLPALLKQRHPDDTNNQSEVTNYSRQNKYLTAVAQASEPAANNVGRGLTSPTLHVDEGPFISWIETTLPAALASGTAAREEARRFGKPYGNIFTTTAGKIDSRDGRYMYNMIFNGTPWNDRFFDCKNRMELLQMIKDNAKGSKENKIIVNCTFSHKQLGYTDDWLAEKMRENNAYGEVADRDFLNRWTSGSMRSPLSVQMNETIKKSEMEPVWTEITKEGFIVRWYDTEVNVRRRMDVGNFILGLDTSEAVGRDAIAGVITDLSDMSVIGTISTNESSLIKFARFVCDLMIKYKRILIIPERKSTGIVIIDALLLHLPLHGEDPFKRIYNTLVDEHTVREDEYHLLSMDVTRRNQQFYDSRKRYFGFMTTASSRNTLYSSVLQQAAKTSGHVVRDKDLSGEIRTLVEKNGRIDHGASGHDDMVVAWLLTHWFANNAKNLKHYGIDSTRINSTKSYDGTNLSTQQIMKIEEQRALSDTITGLVKELENCNDDRDAMLLERRLRVLNARLDTSDDEIFGIDALIRKAVDVRKEKARKQSKNHQDINFKNVFNRFLRR